MKPTGRQLDHSEQINLEVSRLSRWDDGRPVDRLWEMAYRHSRASELGGGPYDVIWTIHDVAFLMEVELEEVVGIISLAGCELYVVHTEFVRLQSGVLARRYIPWRPKEIVDNYLNCCFGVPTFPKASPGFVYVLNAGHGLYKIGHSVDVRARIGALRGQFVGRPLEFMFAIESDTRQQLEYEIHHRYLLARADREFFSLTPDELEELRAIATHHDISSCSRSRRRTAIAVSIQDADVLTSAANWGREGA